MDFARAKSNIARRFDGGLRVLKAAFRVTDHARWTRTAKVDPTWDGRNRILAALIPAGSRVVDLGAGAQTIRRYLPDGCTYTPCDLVQSSEDCIVCDFNRGDFPKSEKVWDVAICSGVLEYVNDPDHFLQQLHRCAARTILSYESSRSDVSRLQRMGHGWVNHMTTDQLEAKLRSAGFKVTAKARWERQSIYDLS